MKTRRSARSFLALAFLTLALTPACARMMVPARSSGPSVSPEGVRITVRAQACTQTQEPDWPDDDLAEEIVEVQVHNVAPAPLTIHRDQFRLVTPDGASLSTLTWGAIEPLIVNAGEIATFRLRFMSRGSLECARELKLDADKGVTLGDRPLKLASVSFVPS